jgi:hypothetical protein
MNNLLRSALEDQESSPDPKNQAAIILKGPLSEVYAQALYLSHGKPEDKADPAAGATEPTPEVQAVLESLKVSLETVQMDQTLLNHMAKLINPATGDAAAVPPQSVYTVSKRGVDEQVVVELTRELASSPGDRRGDFAVVIDATLPGRNSEEHSMQEKFLRFGAALEGLCEAHGVPVYHSLAELLASRA